MGHVFQGWVTFFVKMTRILGCQKDQKRIKKGSKRSKNCSRRLSGQKGVKNDEKNLKNLEVRKPSALKVNRIYGQTSLDSGDLFLGFSTSFFDLFSLFLTLFLTFSTILMILGSKHATSLVPQVTSFSTPKVTKTDPPTKN